MLIKYKKDFEKTAMGLLSYLSDFKNLDNLKDEIKLIKNNNDFQLYLYRNDDSNIIGVIGTQLTDLFVVIRYISLAPGFREKNYQKEILIELIKNNPNKRVSALPEYTYLLKLIKNNNDQKK